MLHNVFSIMPEKVLGNNLSKSVLHKTQSVFLKQRKESFRHFLGVLTSYIKQEHPYK